MSERLSLILNGSVTPIDEVSPTTTLSQWLRSRAGMLGTKEGCAEGDCGACTVLVSDVDARGNPVWRSVNSCIALLPSCAGRSVRTVEGVVDAQGLLHPVQAAMVKHGGSQCGYCTPGFVMSMLEAYESVVDAQRQLCGRLDGNLCRCTGYRPIRDAMVEASRCRDGGAHELFGIGSPAKQPPAAPRAFAFDYDHGDRFVRPTSLPDLLALLAREPTARVLAGATEIGVDIRKKQATAPLLVSLDGVAILTRIDETEDAFIVGAAASLTAFEEALTGSQAPSAPGILRMLRVFASRPIRNRATLGGNLATASPIGDMPPVLLALDAELVIASAKADSAHSTQERRVPIDQFFLGYRKTALQPGEIITAVVVPKLAPRARFDTVKVSKRRDLDISIVAAAFRLDVDARGVISNARLAYGGVAPTPTRARSAEELLVGRALSAPIDDVIAALDSAFAPIDDVRASKAYRQGLASSLFARFMHEQCGGAPSEAFVDADFTEQERLDASTRTRALLHDSARGHVTGSAMYVGDTAQKRAMLELWPVTVPHAHARIKKRDASAARAMPGVKAVLFAEDIPGQNDVGAIRKDEILLALDEVKFHGHPVAVVVADTIEHARRAAQAVVVEAEPLPAILGVRAAIAAGSFHTEPHKIERGDVNTALASAAHVIEAELDIGGQEHFYLESHAAFAEIVEDEVQVWSSTQHPSEIQATVSHVLHVPRHRVVVTSPRMGGGFGGKETQGNTWAALVALAAQVTKKPVRVQLDRDVDMQLTGKRHPFHARYQVGFDERGVISAVDAQVTSDGGWALDLSESILDRALFHLDNAYYFANIKMVGRVGKTHVTSHTAFRGFGGPQGMLVVEDMLARVAGRLGLPPEEVRARNFYRAGASGQETPYGQAILDNRVPRMWSELLASSQFSERRAATDAWNATSPHVKRGLAITPVKFGISFTASFLNQAGALVHMYRDGSVQVNHGGTEMGQGLHTKILGIVMRELGVSVDNVRAMRTATDKVPNTSATAASSAADLNGAAVKRACEELRARIAPVAAALLASKNGAAVRAEDVVFLNGFAMATSSAGLSVPLADVAEAAYMQQTAMSATGFYRTPNIGYDKKAGRGKPFHYFAYGVAVSEVELDGFTGMKR
ncbi:MAG TPA: xanthine dehydrogenase small subunit, partial [Myxococcota bacterium]